MKTKADWEKYNETDETTHSLTLRRIKGSTKEDSVESYSKTFFQEQNLSKYLNPSKAIVQLGAANGVFLEDYKKSGWSVIGYDYSQAAITKLKNKGIETRMVDLNLIDDQQLEQLACDIVNPTNILLIRVLQYLELPALNFLLWYLIDKSAPGSVFFIAGNSNSEEKKNFELPITTRLANYKASFFGGRTDMEFLVDRQVYYNDELLVIRKRDSSK